MVMTRAEIDLFLSEPRIAVLATVDRRGWPLLTPMWYEYADGKLLMTTARYRQKVRNILRDDRVSLCIEHRTRPYRAVVVQGRASLTEENEEQVMRRIFRRYIDREEADRLVDAREPQVVITVTPERTISWDHSKRK